MNGTTGEQQDPDLAQDAGLALECRSVTKRYPDGTVAVDQVDLACRRGEILVLVGPSGCGKTTLLRCVAGLEPVSSGTVLLDDVDVTNVPPHRRGVAMVFQNYALYPNKTVAQNIGFPLHKLPKAERTARVRDIARMLHVEGLLHRRPRQLSGGERQRVGIGRALVRRPSLVAMDEPLSNLDAQLRVEMRTEIRSLQRQLGMTMAYVTHDQTEALSLADRLVVLNNGRAEQVDTPAGAFDRPATRFVAGFLGAMNLLTGPAVSVPPWAGTADPDGLVVGVRPEQLRVGPAPSGRWSATGRVESVELLGTERLVSLRLGDVAGERLRVRVPADQPIGEELTAWAEDRHVHLFDRRGVRVPGQAERSVASQAG